MRVLRPRLLASILALVASAAAVRAQSPTPQSIITTGSTLPVLESYLESLRQQTGIPGMSAAVVTVDPAGDGGIAWYKGFGYENVAARIRATPDTPYLVGDATQTFAAVLLLQCVEQKRVALDDPMESYGLSAPEPSATLRQLLEHETQAGFVYSPERFSHVTELMEWCAPQPFRKSIAHRILNRLAMTDSAPGTDWKDPKLTLPEGMFDDADRAHYRSVLDRLAVPYKVQGRSKTERTELPAMGINATAGLVSTVRDLAKFDRALDAGDEGGLLKVETLVSAWTPAADATGAAKPMGLGWFVQYYKGERVVWHFGNVPNAYSSLILKLPARNMTFILLANSDGLSAPFDLAQGDVTKSLFASLFLKLAT